MRQVAKPLLSYASGLDQGCPGATDTLIATDITVYFASIAFASARQPSFGLVRPHDWMSTVHQGCLRGSSPRAF